MASRVESFQGKTREECLEILNSKFTGYQIIHEMPKKVLFWVKSYEIKVLIHENEKKEEKQKPILIKEKLEVPQEDARKTALLEALNSSEPLGKEKEKEKQINDDNQTDVVKSIIDELMKKIEGESVKRQLPLPLEKMENLLKEQEVDDRTARIYVEKIEEKFKDTIIIEEKEVHESIQALIENQISISEPLDINKKQVIALVGPTGVGKTTTLAKIGWELHRNKKTVGFITTDTFRSGAYEQLKNYGETMDAETMVAKGVKELKEAMSYFQNVNKVDHILIDTVGRNPMLEQSVESVSEYLEVSQPTLTCLVLSSTSKVRDLKEIIGRFSSVKVDSLVFTKLDETYNVGSLLNVFNFSKIPLLYVTDGQDITKNIYAPTKKVLSEKILNKSTEFEGRIFA